MADAAIFSEVQSQVIDTFGQDSTSSGESVEPVTVKRIRDERAEFRSMAGQSAELLLLGRSALLNSGEQLFAFDMTNDFKGLSTTKYGEDFFDFCI